MIVKMKTTYPNPTQPQQLLAGRIHSVTPHHLARSMTAAGLCEPSTLDALKEQEAYDALLDAQGLLVTLRQKGLTVEGDAVERLIDRLEIVNLKPDYDRLSA